VPHRRIFVLAALAAGAVFAFQLRPSGAALQLESGIVLPQPRQLPAFALVDQRGRPFSHHALEGRWTLVFAGFTHCPDICPATLSTLKAVQERLDDLGAEVQTVFLSLDPERDDPGTLAQYLAHFDPAIIGVTGARVELDKLMSGLGLVYLKVPSGPQQYTIDHSAAVALVDPHARVAAYFKPPLRPEALAADLATASTARH
jgi:protein SCO1